MLERTAAADASSPLEVRLEASEASPVDNLALVIEGWGEAAAGLDIDGKAVPVGRGFRIGHRHTLDGTDLIVWVELESDHPVGLRVTPAEERVGNTGGVR